MKPQTALRPVLYPLTFHPIFKERPWGGRNLARLYGKDLPPDKRIGESWEISDRPEGVSLIANGPLAGKSLRWLMETRSEELMGTAQAPSGRFPLLIKLLDAQEQLSLQVHPPAAIAARLGGEPKAEMWYVADAQPGAEILVGLRHGVSRDDFERKIAESAVADCFHRINVREGDAIFLPSGRVHAIGGGLVLFEIQQNSDTTYRVFDWNRRDASGRPRELHIAESLASIDFEDFEPGLIAGKFKGAELRRKTLVAEPVFSVEECALESTSPVSIRSSSMRVIGVLNGWLRIDHDGETLELEAGRFALIPASLQRFTLSSDAPTRFLQAMAGEHGIKG